MQANPDRHRHLQRHSTKHIHCKQNDLVIMHLRLHKTSSSRVPSATVNLTQSFAAHGEYIDNKKRYQSYKDSHVLQGDELYLTEVAEWK